MYLAEGEDILKRFRGEVNVGIVPHDVFPRYCGGLLPDRFGRFQDFIQWMRRTSRSWPMQWNGCPSIGWSSRILESVI